MRMKLFKKLYQYNEQEVDGAVFGFGILRAKNYDTGEFGHLLLFSMNLQAVKFIKKLFIPI
jgi:hypothetical protein